MFGGGSSSSQDASKSDSVASSETTKADRKSFRPDMDSAGVSHVKADNQAVTGGEKCAGNISPTGRQGSENGSNDKKRRSSTVGSKASSLIASAKNSLNFSQANRANNDAGTSQTPLQKLGKEDPALVVPQGQHNNSAGESHPGPRSTFRVGVWEDRNKKCRRTMEDTHAFLYNFLHTPAPVLGSDSFGKSSGWQNATTSGDSSQAGSANGDMLETDNGYFAIFDGHAGTFAADWCGKKLHIILQDAIKQNPNLPVPELLDQTFTAVDAQLDKLPTKNSGCTAAVAVLRWEDRVPSLNSATGSQSIAPAAAAAVSNLRQSKFVGHHIRQVINKDAHAKLQDYASRQRVLYTANVGDARIVLCRAGKALRLSYDHKGNDENEGKRIANAGGLILNNRVNGVLAVTRALGDTYMKDLVTGHPYTTETVIQPESDEFIIIACDGLWDVCSDQEAVDLVRNIMDPAAAAKTLVNHALGRFSTDNLSCMLVRFNRAAVLETQKDKAIGVEGDASGVDSKPSEVDKIVSSTKLKIAEGGTAAVGVSASNSGLGHDPTPLEESEAFIPTALKGPVAEEEARSPGEVNGPAVTAGAIPQPDSHLSSTDPANSKSWLKPASGSHPE